MTWIKLDDSFADHPKLLAAGDLAGWLWVCGLGYCSKHLTDGFIPTAVLGRLTGLANPRKLAGLLVEHDLWIEVEGGWRVHNYEVKQRTREQIESDRAATADRVRKHRDKRARNAVTNGARNAPVTASDTEADTEQLPPGGDGTPPPEPDQPSSRSECVTLVAGYVDDYRTTHHGNSPIRAWRDQAGQHVKNFLAEGVPAVELAACLSAIAKESKSPTALAHVLADYHQAEAAS